MSEQPSTWSRVRKRLAPVALLVALVLLATDTCASEMASVELVIDPGAAQPRLAATHLAVHRDGEVGPVALFDSTMPGRDVRWSVRLDPGSYRLAVRARLVGGAIVRFDRRFEARDNAIVRFAVERDLLKEINNDVDK